MVKVKVEKVGGAGEVEGPKVSGKKNKKEKKVLKVISKRIGTADASVAKKRNRRKKNKTNTNGIIASPETKNAESSPTVGDEKSEPTGVAKKKRNRRRKNKTNTNGIIASLETKNAESSPTVGDEKSEPTGVAKKKRNRRKKNKTNTHGIIASPETKNAESSPTVGDEKSEPTSDISSSSVEKLVKEEPASTISETPEAATKTTELGENETPNTQGKKKRRRKNKRKASEALEGASETMENEEDDSGDTAEEQKGTKRMKVEEKKTDTEEDKPKKETKKMKAEKKKAGDAGDKSESKKKQQQPEKKYVLFLGNLPFELTDDEVREHFKVVGDNIVRVTLMQLKKSGKGKGYGFIEFKDAAAYNKALKLNLSQLKDRKINVQFTTPGKNTKTRKAFMKNKTKKLLGQMKGKKVKKEKRRTH